MTDSTAPVSVVIPTFNAGRFILEAVESVLSQTTQPREVIVVDDGSTDGTRERLRPFMSRITYVHQENRGVAVARNRGLAEASSEWVAFLDADDKWMPTKIERQWEYARRHPDVDLVHTARVDLVEETQALQEAPTRQYHEQLCRKATIEHAVNAYYPLLFFGNWLTLSSVMVRRERVAAAGGFDERITRATSEDYDLWIRLARRCRFGFVGEALTIYRLHGLSSSHNRKVMRSFEVYTIEKALQSDPDLPRMIGPEAVRRRLVVLWSSLADLSHQEGDFKTAHRAAARLLRLNPDTGTLRQYVVTSFPAPMIRALQRLRAGTITPPASTGPQHRADPC